MTTTPSPDTTEHDRAIEIGALRLLQTEAQRAVELAELDGFRQGLECALNNLPHLLSGADDPLTPLVARRTCEQALGYAALGLAGLTHIRTLLEPIQKLVDEARDIAGGLNTKSKKAEMEAAHSKLASAAYNVRRALDATPSEVYPWTWSYQLTDRIGQGAQALRETLAGESRYKHYRLEPNVEDAGKELYAEVAARVAKG